MEDGSAPVSAADELRALTAAATPGPWERCGGGDSCGEPIYGELTVAIREALGEGS